MRVLGIELEQAVNRIQALHDSIEITQWMMQDVTQPTAAHASSTTIEQGKQRRFGFTAQGFGQFQIAARHGIESDVITFLLQTYLGDMTQSSLLRRKLGVACILQHRAGSRQCLWVA